MNLVYSQNGKKGLIRTDESELTCDNLSQMIEILKTENVHEQLSSYYERDNKRLEELKGRKLKLNRVTCGTLIGSIGVSGVLSLMNAYNAIDSDFAIGVQMTAAAVGGTVTLLNETVLSRRRELLGLMECLRYEKSKLEDLENRLETLNSVSELIDGEDSTLIDTRSELRQLDDVLNFIFYYGANKKKVQRMYEKCEIMTFLERCGIYSFATIAEIEDYLFREFNQIAEYEMIKK